MSYTYRGRRTAYDNVAVGTSNTTRERTIIGVSPSTPLPGGLDRIAVGGNRVTDKALNRILVSAGSYTTNEPREYPENQN